MYVWEQKEWIPMSTVKAHRHVHTQPHLSSWRRVGNRCLIVPGKLRCDLLLQPPGRPSACLTMGLQQESHQRPQHPPPPPKPLPGIREVVTFLEAPSLGGWVPLNHRILGLQLVQKSHSTISLYIILASLDLNWLPSSQSSLSPVDRCSSLEKTWNWAEICLSGAPIYWEQVNIFHLVLNRLIGVLEPQPAEGAWGLRAKREASKSPKGWSSSPKRPPPIFNWSWDYGGRGSEGSPDWEEKGGSPEWKRF